MNSNFVLVTIALGVMFPSLAIQALFLRLGLRWAKVADAQSWRVVGATAIMYGFQLALSVLIFNTGFNTIAQIVFFLVLALFTVLIIPFVVVLCVFQLNAMRTLQVTALALLAQVVMLGFVTVILRPFIYEAYYIPTNAMAPTILGEHWTSTCPECGEPNYCSPRHERFGGDGPMCMICERFHIAEVDVTDKKIAVGERILVAKFLNPRRWDLVVFQYPTKPSIMYVKRLVGLPGETIVIKDGSVWVDGVKQTPPDVIRDLEYGTELWQMPQTEVAWGSPEKPAALSDDEYFVLGDFSVQASDSRWWPAGAPEHHPYAVPKSNMIGVVTHTFWPLPRWRTHR